MCPSQIFSTSEFIFTGELQSYGENVVATLHYGLLLFIGLGTSIWLSLLSLEVPLATFPSRPMDLFVLRAFGTRLCLQGYELASALWFKKPRRLFKHLATKREAIEADTSSDSLGRSVERSESVFQLLRRETETSNSLGIVMFLAPLGVISPIWVQSVIISVCLCHCSLLKRHLCMPSH